MKQTNCYTLSFGKIVVLKDNLAEVIVDEGVEMDMPAVGEFHDFLLSNFKAPICLLVNKCNSYSYTFEAQKNIVSLKEIKVVAVVVNTVGSEMAAEMVLNISKTKDWYAEIFRKRDEALNWIADLAS